MRALSTWVISTMLLISSIANADGLTNIYAVFLDSSLANSNVYVYPPQFIPDRSGEDYGKDISCMSWPNSYPMEITGLNKAKSDCTPISNHGLQPGHVAFVNMKIRVGDNEGHTLDITEFQYRFDPWHEGDGPKYIILLYLTKDNKLSYRLLNA